MTSIILDAGALIAVERNDREFLAAIRTAQQRNIDLRAGANVIGQVWRTGFGRQALLSRFLSGVTVEGVSPEMGYDAGRLLSGAGTNDVVDATVVLMAKSTDVIFTSDPDDVELLVRTLDLNVTVLRC
jgi:hypothetical protein